MKLRTRLFALVTLTLLPLVAIEVFDEIDARSSRAEEGNDQALRLAQLVANEQSKVVEGARQLLTALGKVPVVQSRDMAACDAYFAELARSYVQYSAFIISDLAGHVVCSGGYTEASGSVADRSYFKLAIKTGGFALGEYAVEDRWRQSVLYLAQPYYNSAGVIQGVVAVGLSLEWLQEEVVRNSLPPKATVSIIDRQGTILARYPGGKEYIGTRMGGPDHSDVLSGREGVHEAPGLDGITRIYSYAPLPIGSSGLTVSIGLDKGELLKGFDEANRRDILVIAGSFVLALILAGSGARVFFSRPIRILLDAAERWRQGDLETRVRFQDGLSEFGRLGAAFNSMAAALGVREQELECKVDARTKSLREAMRAQQEAEAALYESRKLETVGQLTGGVAHDFNNILAAIVGNLDLARSRLTPGHPVLPRLEAATKSANRGAALTQQLLAFARRQNLRPEIVDVNRHISSSQEMLQRLLRSDVAVKTRLAPEAWPVRVDPNQLEAAILNLAVNARDAMPRGGTLQVETRNESFTGNAHPTGLAGDFVALVVSDTGTGIPPEILSKVFEPFFTTKEVGAGSGLGLSMVHGFVKQSAGSVFIESQSGQGTSVTLYFPRSAEAPPPFDPPVEEVVGGEGTVLLVEDDAEVRVVITEMLELAGYSVLTACNATEATACFQREPSRIDILITDLVLPDGMNGIELTTAIHDSQPALPVLLITGYSGALLKYPAHGNVVLTKPFTHAQLARAVRQTRRASTQKEGVCPTQAIPVSVVTC
jgi:signal transduction histidine kinase/CheY-like chemotaxis protein